MREMTPGCRSRRSSVVNNAGTFGGAIASEDSDLSVTESTFEKNKASSKGGAFFVKSTESYLWDSKIIGNLASQAGAGIYKISSTIFLTNIVIESNQHPRHGGGVYSRDGIMLFDNCALKDNSATSGGGIYSENGGFTISQSELSFNDASKGGAIHLTGGYRIAQIIDSTLQRNSAVFFGDGVATRDGRVTIKGVTFRNHESGLYGGANYSGSGSKLDVSNTTITRNSAKSYGGGVAVRVGTARLANITLVNNSAAVEGGGIFTRFATLRLHNSILAGNQFGDCSTFSEMDEKHQQFDPRRQL